jgi:hypothetical protein
MEKHIELIAGVTVDLFAVLGAMCACIQPAPLALIVKIIAVGTGCFCARLLLRGLLRGLYLCGVGARERPVLHELARLIERGCDGKWMPGAAEGKYAVGVTRPFLLATEAIAGHA